MVAASRTRHASWAIPLLVATAYLLSGSTIRVWMMVSVAGVAAGCALVAAIRQRAQRSAWMVLAVALFSNAVADMWFTIEALRFDDQVPFPSLIDGFYLAFYPLFGLGLWLLARERGRDRTSLIDAAIVAVGSSVVVWQFLVLPLATDDTLSGAARLVSTCYPVGDVILLAFVARLFFGPGDSPRSLRVLGAGVAMLLVADVTYLITDLYSVNYSPGSWGDGAYLVSYGLLSCAALRCRTIPAPAPTALARQRLGWGRLGLLTAASLLAPAVAIATSRGLELPALASAVLFLLVMARIAGLLQALSRSGERRFESLVAKSSELVAILDGTAVRYASPSMLRAAGVVGDTADGFSLERLVHDEDLEAVKALLDAVSEAGSGFSLEGEFRVRWPDGGSRVVSAVATNLRTDPDIGGVVLNAHDIDQLRRLASFDPLTGLANRSEYTRRLDTALAGGQELSVLLFDLDGFKEINDSLGHHAGDAVLTEAAGRLERLAPAGATVARLGGDEFALLQPDCDAAAATLTAASALESLRRPIAVDGVAVGVGTSIGIVCRTTLADSQDTVSSEELLRCADIAMYRAKADGRGRAVVYELEMGEPVRRRLELRNALEHALDGRQMEVYYQPLCRIEDGSTIGFEALLRWHHPEHGPIAPAEFIPAAEESHHIITLGRWVLDQAVRQIAMWQRLGPQWRDLAVSVNVSPRQLHDPALVSTVAQLLASTAIDPSCLVLEITEQAVVDNPAAAIEIFRRLKDLGLRLAIDDYGSGNASISYLRQFPIDEIKIDRSLICRLSERADSHQALVRSILELAAALELTTVCEGIETTDQARALQNLGARHGQGYLLGYPSPATEITSRLERPVVTVLAGSA